MRQLSGSAIEPHVVRVQWKNSSCTKEIEGYSFLYISKNETVWSRTDLKHMQGPQHNNRNNLEKQFRKLAFLKLQI